MADSWSLQDIVEYFKADPEISSGLDEDDWKSLSNPDDTFINLLKEALQYQGFDPKVILRELVRSNIKYKADNTTPLQ